MEKFLSRHNDSIIGVLSGFDRVLFRGTLRSISYLDGMKVFLSTHKVLLKDFKEFVSKHSYKIKCHAIEFAQRHGRPYKYIDSPSESKEKIAKQIMEQDHIKKGLICVLSCVELCQTYAIRKDKFAKKLKLVPRKRPCQHFYFYFIDREFGFMHVRLQSWFPCSIQVCINGREWLASKMDKASIKYEQRENCFVYIENIKKAQKMADSMSTRNWHRLLDRFGKKLNPLLHECSELDIHGYYWTIRQGEYATDVMFKDSSVLAKLYPKLTHHAIENFSSEQVMRFLGRRTNILFKGEIISDMSKRVEGTRVRHWVEENSIKMYDKQGSVLRIETTINNPRRFKVYRDAFRQGKKVKAWIPMRKGVADVYRHVEVSRAANARYLDALSVIGDEEPSHLILDSVSKPINKKGHRYRALRPVSPDEANLFRSALQGEFLIRGFRNADIRTLLFQESNSNKEKHRNMGRTSRLLRLLRAHGLIHKVSKTRLYRISNKGQKIMSTALTFRDANIQLLAKAA